MAGAIVVGYDGSEGSEGALAEALRLSGELSAPLVAVFGFQEKLAERQAADYRKALHDLGKERLQNALDKAREAGIEAEAVVVAKRPSEALAQVAEERDGRCIVVGTNGEGPIKGALLGSTAYKLLHVSDRPVVVVPA
jgi:nucleotide-binding universal stress UspA family protein